MDNKNNNSTIKNNSNKKINYTAANLLDRIKSLNWVKISIIILFLIIIASASYILINRYIKQKQYYNGYSFYDKNITDYEPLFKLNTMSLEECKEKCLKSPKCYGASLNLTENMCYGTGKDGVLREEDDSKVWLKKEDSAFIFDSNLLVVETKSPFVVNRKNIITGYTPNNFNYNFYLYIEKLHTGHWQHILHKGTEYKQKINTADWDEITRLIPEQYIGAWIAPFTNTMRIAITLNDGSMDYVDIPNLPLNKASFISVNVVDKYIEIYIDSLLVKIKELKKSPLYNPGNLYCKSLKSFKGSLLYLTYTPEYTTIKNIKELNKSSLEEVNDLIVKMYSSK